MCHFELSIESIEIAHLIDFKSYFAPELADLREMEAADVAAGPVLDMAGIAADPHFAARGDIVELDGTPMQGLIARLSAPLATFAAMLLTTLPVFAANDCSNPDYNLMPVKLNLISLPAKFCAAEGGLNPSLLTIIITGLNAIAIGIVVGAVAGYFGGWWDRLVTRLSDTIMAFPLFVLAMGIVASILAGRLLSKGWKERRLGSVGFALVFAGFVEGVLKYSTIHKKMLEFKEHVEKDGKTKLYIAGEPMLKGWIYHFSAELWLIFGLTFLVITVMLWIHFRSWSGVLVPLLGTALSAVWGLGYVGWMGFNAGSFLGAAGKPIDMASASIDSAWW